jgi:hypothetical protein
VLTHSLALSLSCATHAHSRTHARAHTHTHTRLHRYINAFPLRIVIVYDGCTDIGVFYDEALPKIAARQAEPEIADKVLLRKQLVSRVRMRQRELEPEPEREPERERARVCEVL